MTAQAVDRPSPTRGELASRIARIGLVVGIVAAALLSKMKLCPMAALVGHPCPGCGLTRSTLAAVRGDLLAAFHMQPFAFIATPLLAVMAVDTARQFLLTGRASLSRRFAPVYAKVFAVTMVSMVAFWVARFFGFWGGPVPV